jgi:iron transport multicopper oxidase
MKLLGLISFAWFATFVFGETHTWWFKTTLVNANPDRTFEREMIGFNDTWPLPILRAKKGDTINLYLINGFTDRNTSLHFHGLFQNGSAQMDGPQFITQCPIPANDTMLYNFTLTQAGTYWYHSHTAGQYGDGMRGAFIIEDDEPLPFHYDEELVLTLSDHYHDFADVLLPKFLNRYNPTGAEPIPKNLLFNETRNVSWVVEPNKTYFVRIINMGVFVSQYLYMEDHEFEIVEVDGVFVEKNSTDLIYITVAQRYGVLIHTKNDTSKNYAFMNAFDTGMLDFIPDDLVLNSTNYIVYDEDADKPDEYFIDDWDAHFNDFYLVPVGAQKEELYPDPDYTITVDVAMDNLGNGINYAFFNNITFTAPKVPTLMTALSAGELATDATVYGTNTHTYVLDKGDTIDLVINNLDTGRHPFHLHGHIFQLIARGAAVDDADPPVLYNESDHPPFPQYPMMRDTVYVEPQSYMVYRFKADNPGVWFFHCHIQWHLDQGLALVLVEDPLGIQAVQSQQLSEDNKRACQKLGIPIEANAAANKDFLDLTGQNVQVGPLPSGFTARGIVALVFSCIAGILGLIAIAIYGMAEINNVEARVAEELDVDLRELVDDDDESADTDHLVKPSSSK